MNSAIAQLLATMTDPLLLVGTTAIWFVCRRWGWLAAWWISLVYASVLAVAAYGTHHGDRWFRMCLAATIITTLWWAVAKVLASKPTTKAPLTGEGTGR